MPMKFTLGMFLCALGFLTAAAAGMWFADAQGLTSPWFIVLVYLFQSLGELLISALGLAMVANIAADGDQAINQRRKSAKGNKGLFLRKTQLFNEKDRQDALDAVIAKSFP